IRAAELTLGLRLRELERSALRGEGRAQEPGPEGAVEGIEVLVAGDEGLPQRPVDVVLPLELDPVKAAERIGDAARADLEAGVPKHPPEGDHMANDGFSGHCAPLRRAPEVPRRARTTGPRGT